MELLSSIFGLSMIAISVCFARRFFWQMRDDRRYRHELMDDKRRRRHSPRHAGEARF